MNGIWRGGGRKGEKAKKKREAMKERKEFIPKFSEFFFP